MRVAVVGHVEWVEFVAVEHVPAAGEIIHAAGSFEEPAGGGGVASVQLARLAGGATLFTALGDDERGARARVRLGELGVRVEAVTRPGPQRRAITFVDGSGERTITVLGERVVPAGDDPLPWELLAEMDAVYLTGGDVAAVRAARAARTLVATARAQPVLGAAGVLLDALVHSGSDPSEAYSPGDLDPPPALVVSTDGERGGRFAPAGGPAGTWRAAAPPGPVRDTYGAGDSFAAGLTYALGRGDAAPAAVLLGARCGAACVSGRGPYGASPAPA